MSKVPQTIQKISSVKRFYFLEYFYVLLKSIEKHSDKSPAFELFKVLKQEHRLGESKYRIKFDSETLSQRQMDRYRYTFGEVIDEAKDYGLVDEPTPERLVLTSKGQELLNLYRPRDPRAFNLFLFDCMERAYQAFRYFVEMLYRNNKKRPGLLIFPVYSPRQLSFHSKEVSTVMDIHNYATALVEKLQEDLDMHLGIQRDLADANREILARLRAGGLLPDSLTEPYAAGKYNAIVKRFRDFWLTYFLNNVYGCEYSLSSFERWLYRGKQIGIVYATDFYPAFDGRIVYATSVVASSVRSRDFESIFEYPDRQQLCVHRPDWEQDRNQNSFVKSLLDAYLRLRRSNRSYFINLLSVRELVCYSLKISDYLFEEFLDKAYRLNLLGELPTIRISLEVDKLPEETNAIYLKQEPVMVDGRYRNIIAIDVAKEAR